MRKPKQKKKSPSKKKKRRRKAETTSSPTPKYVGHAIVNESVHPLIGFLLDKIGKEAKGDAWNAFAAHWGVRILNTKKFGGGSSYS